MKQYGIMMTPESVEGLKREVCAPGTGKTQSRRTSEKVFIKASDSRTGRDVSGPSLWANVQVGERLWVRERLIMSDDSRFWMHAADRNIILMEQTDKRASAMIAWAHHQVKDVCSARHMPKWASRFTLIVTGTKIERLQDISEADAIAEGVEVIHDPRGTAYRAYEKYPDGTDHPHNAAPMRSPIFSYRQIWEGMHGRGTWDANPLVVALTFKVIHAHIDTPEARAAA